MASKKREASITSLCGARDAAPRIESQQLLEEVASEAHAQLASANQRNEELARRCAAEEETKNQLAMQLASVEEEAATARARNSSLLEATQQATQERLELESRLSSARLDLDVSQQQARLTPIESASATAPAPDSAPALEPT